MKIKGIRWWMVALITAGLVVNYLARNTLSVAAPTMMSQLNISTEQYSHIVFAWQMGYAFMQPVAGYIIDAIGTKLGFAIFAVAWSLACAAAALATGWQSLASLRALLVSPKPRASPQVSRPPLNGFPPRSALSPSAGSTSVRPSVHCWRRRWWPGRFSTVAGKWRSSPWGFWG